MMWEKKRLNECCLSIADGDHQPPPKTEAGVPFVTIANIVNNKFNFENTMFAPESYYNSLDNKRKTQVGDVLYSVVGSFGIPVLIKEDLKFVFQRHIAILRCNKEILLPEFLFYTMLTRNFYMIADSVALGAAQRTISLTALRNIEIEVPPIEIQIRIVNKLSLYDKLIENNKKQIMLLEEASQRLYKEWFAGADASVLENTTLSEIVTFKRGKTITKAQTIEGNIPVVAGGLEPAYYHNEANTTAPVITVSGSGANAGFVRMYFEDVFASDCSFADSRTTPYLYFVYCFLKENKSQLDALQKGSAQPHVYAKDINAMVMKSFPEQKLEQFCGLVKPYFELIGNLEKQSKSAIEARDRLLPKLMNGEIEI